MRSKCITSAKHKSKKSSDSDDLISVILLCDSPGHRMRSYGPIPLVQIDKNFKLIDLQIEAIKSVFNNFEIVLCLGFDSDRVYKYVKSKYQNLPIRIVENQLYDISNSCESLRLSLTNTFNSKIVVCDGGLLINKQILSLVSTNDSCVLVEDNPNNTLEIGVNIDSGHAQYFSFGAKNTWSEIIFLDGYHIINNLIKVLFTYENKNRFMFEAFNELININNKFKIVRNPNKLLKLNNIKTYHSIKGSK